MIKKNNIEFAVPLDSEAEGFNVGNQFDVDDEDNLAELDAVCMPNYEKKFFRNNRSLIIFLKTYKYSLGVWR